MTDKPSIFELIGRVMEDVQAVGKKDRNTEQNYSFRGIDAVVNAAGPAFRKHGVVSAPMLQRAGYRDVQTNRGKPSRECTVEVTYRFYGPQGDYIDATVPGESMDFGDKGTAKAMSVAYRIALLQVLCIPTDEPDADSQSYERDDWDAATPASAGQAKRFEDLAKEISEAPDRRAIALIGKRVNEALSARDITKPQYDLLDVKAGERIAELQPAEAPKEEAP